MRRNAMPLYELKEMHPHVLSLFPSADHLLVIKGLIEGKCAGKILVDDTKAPKSAAAWTMTGDDTIIYMGGSHENPSFREALKKYFVEEIKPESVNQGLDAFEVYPCGKWEDVLPLVFGEDILRERDSYYRLNPLRFNQLQQNWRENIPDGFTLNRAETRDVFEADVPVFKGVTPWTSFEKFQEYGFAYYLLEDKTEKIVAGCKTKVVTSRGCEVAIGTEEHYRKRGFATLTACATVSEALEKNLDVIWECYHRNVGSIKTNQKLGFEYLGDEPFYFAFLFESLQNDLFAGYYHLLELNDPHKASEWFRKAIVFSEKEDQPISSGYNFYAACAFAWAGEYELSLARLKMAAETTRDAVSFLNQVRGEKAFANLPSSDLEGILRELESR